MHDRFALVFLATAAFLPLSGSALHQARTEQKSSTNAQQARTDPEQQVLNPRQLFPLSPRQKMFRITEGEDRGVETRLELARSESGDVEWWLTLEGYNRTGLVVTEDGAILIRRLDLLDENRSIRYEPPVPLLPATIRPGERYSTTSRAEVFDLETGESEQEGRARHTIETISRARFQTPIGEVEGSYVEISHSVNLDLAELRLRLECGYEKGGGMIYRRVTHTIEKIGLFGDTTTRRAEIAEPIDRGSAAEDAAGD